MKIINKILLLLLLASIPLLGFGQESSKVKNNVISGNFIYGMHVPRQDMATRFGQSLEVGIGSDFITYKNRFVFGLTGTIIFGNEVREDVLAIITNDDGNVVGTNQQVGIVAQKQRGFYVGGHVGKIFRFSDKTMSGIRLTAGVGLLQHKIRLQDDLGTVNLLKGENIKGFDRLTNGLTFNQFLGYQHFGKSGLFNVFGGLESYQGFTMSRRSYDNTLMAKDDRARMDVLVGIKFGFMIKFNLAKNPEDIYY